MTKWNMNDGQLKQKRTGTTNNAAPGAYLSLDHIYAQNWVQQMNLGVLNLRNLWIDFCNYQG